MPSRAHDLIAAAQDALRDIRDHSDYRLKRVWLKYAQVQALCALAAALDHLAEALNEENE